MQILSHPDYSEDDSNKGPIRKFLMDLAKKDPELFSAVMIVFDGIKKHGLEKYQEMGIVGRLSYVSEPIFELKIPPKGRSRGVARFYCCRAKGNLDTLYILTCEKKHGTPKADKKKIKVAQQYYRNLYK